MPTQLLSGETVVATERQHPAVLVPAAVVAILCIAVPAVLIHLIPTRVGSFNTATVKLIATAAIAVLVLLWLLVRVLRWRFTTYTLTSHRIVMSSGVISRITKSINLDRVQDIVVRKPIAQRLIHAGSVEIDAAGRDGVEVLRLIPRPDRFYTEILQAVENHRQLSVGYPLAAGAPPPGSYPPPPPAPYDAGGV